MTTGVRALYLAMFHWSEHQSAEEYAEELQIEGVNAWYDYDSDTVTVESRGSTTTVLRGGAVFRLGSQHDLIVVGLAEEVEEILTEENAT